VPVSKIKFYYDRCNAGTRQLMPHGWEIASKKPRFLFLKNLKYPEV